MSASENGLAVPQGEGKDPSSFLSNIIGCPVIVKLNSGVIYKGKKPMNNKFSFSLPPFDDHSRKYASARLIHRPRIILTFRGWKSLISYRCR